MGYLFVTSTYLYVSREIEYKIKIFSLVSSEFRLVSGRKNYALRNLSRTERIELRGGQIREGKI